MHILIIEREARLDVAEAIAFYDGERMGLGEDFLTELNSLLLRVGENPRLYQIYRRETRKAVMRRFPFVVLYRFDEERAYIIAVMDGRRNPSEMIRRASKN